jgi:hypothetical protein
MSLSITGASGIRAGTVLRDSANPGVAIGSSSRRLAVARESARRSTLSRRLSDAPSNAERTARRSGAQTFGSHRESNASSAALRSGCAVPAVCAQRGSRRRDRDAPDSGRARVGRRGMRRPITPIALVRAWLLLRARAGTRPHGHRAPVMGDGDSAPALAGPPIRASTITSCVRTDRVEGRAT